MTATGGRGAKPTDVDSLVQEELKRRQVKKSADAIEAGLGAPDLAQFSCSLREEIAQAAKRPKIPMAIESLAGNGHLVPIVSSRKSGKTTLVMNAARDGITGQPFLGRFKTDIDGGNAAFINTEMTGDDYREYAESTGLTARMPGNSVRRGWVSDRVFMIHCRDNGLRINLLNDITAERVVKWLVEHDIAWWFPDPWKNFVTWAGGGLKDNDVVAALTDRFLSIASEAGVTLTGMPLHTTQTAQEPGAERGKGAGELEDGADALWRYTRVVPADPLSPRSLVAEGRSGVGASCTVHFDGTGRLSFSEESREEAKVKADGEVAYEALVLELAKRQRNDPAVYRINAGDFQAILSGTKEDRVARINAAVRIRKVAREDMGVGKPTWYSLREDDE